MIIGKGALPDSSEQNGRLSAALAARESDLDSLRAQISTREEMIERRLVQEREAMERRELERQMQWEKQLERVHHQEQAYAKRQEMLEERLRAEHIAAEERRREYNQKQMELEALQHSLEQERARLTQESQKTLQENSKRFVSSALEVLGTKEGHFHNIGIYWAVAGAASLLVGVAVAIIGMMNSADVFHQGTTSLSYYIFHLFRGLIVVGLCGALARYAFIFSSSYMHESLKAGERAHAIRFGEFYLDSYGANAQWDQVKEAFIHWNIAGQSAFSRADVSADPVSAGVAERLLEKATEIAAATVTKSDPK
ncbi:hypothetical protein MXF29_00235 [Pseudomonas sp. NC26]|uniref:hypothetical protein n=1 Tax=Pseudomonas sp. NC26 TaxID=3114535 RepID=UPI002DE58982|nr:hypothetical protein [Pseudomonas sp. NC26]